MAATKATVKKTETKKTENKKKKRVSKNISHGQCHIFASFNNIIITFTDASGNVISWSSSGKLGFKSSKKSTPFAAQECMADAAKVARENGIKSVDCYVKGPGNGREAAIRAIGTAEIEVTMIKDVSPIAHNGCRPPKVRRI